MKCPKCTTMMTAGAQCPDCGWQSKPAASKRSEKVCEFSDYGNQCGKYGHLSTGTTGQGPWYCRDHFARIMGWPALQAINVDDSQAAIDERVNKLVPRLKAESEHAWSMRCRTWCLDRLKGGLRPRRSASEHWAHVLATHNPESVGYRYAAEVRKNRPVRERQPGEDDE